VLIDLQNAGSRFYTYESSMHDVIRAAAALGIRVLIADRPNPIGGEAVDGPVLEPGHASYVGRAPIALRHGLTMGELGRLFAAQTGSPEPEVSTLSGWSRDMLFPETGLFWVPPSPNLPTPGSALTYPGTCLFEATQVSVGRGTTTPFEMLGAPWMDGGWARDLRAADLPGVVFRAAYFAPVAGLHAGELCAGVQLHVTDPQAFDPLLTAMHMLSSAWRRWPEQLGLRPTLELLAGTDRIREGLLAGRDAERIIELWQTEAAQFRDVREGVLLY
jgi:uncharacterized protein YbbC (DUF1343 family)